MPSLSRRAVVKSGASLFAALLASDGWAGPRRRRRVKRRMRRRIRRRIRRRVLWRSVGARRALVVPLGLAVGWELAVAAERANQPDVVVVVKEIRVVDNRQVVVAVAPDGTVTEFLVDREDTPENAVLLPGSELAAADSAVPGVEAEVDEEQEVDE